MHFPAPRLASLATSSVVYVATALGLSSFLVFYPTDAAGLDRVLASALLSASHWLTWWPPRLGLRTG